MTMNKKQIKKARYLLKAQFKDLISLTINLPLRSRLRVVRIILFKNKKLINIKD